MAKKAVAALLTLVLLFSLLGCNKKQAPAKPSQPQTPEITLTKEQEKLVPNNTTVLTALDGTLKLSSQDSLDRVIAFYEDVIAQQKIVGQETTPALPEDAGEVSAWYFDGVSPEDTPFSVKLLSDDTQVSIVVEY